MRRSLVRQLCNFSLDSPFQWSALPAYVLRSTRPTRKEASRTAISESFRNLYRAPSPSKAAPSEGRAPYQSFHLSHGDLPTSKCAIQFWMPVAVAVGKGFNLMAPLKPAGGRAVVQAQCIKQQVAESCFLQSFRVNNSPRCQVNWP